MECLWEDPMGSGGSSRTLIIAGIGLSLDIDFTNNAVNKVSLSFLESPEIVTKHASKAGEVLLQDLQLGREESPLTKMLGRFAVNLERLAALDKLSVLPSLNCHEAIAGIYESLKRLHEWEIARLKDEDAMSGRSADYITKAALCTKSGRPIMNTRGNVGLSFDYWQEKHLVTKKPKSKAPNIDEDNEPKTWSLIIECAPSSALVYPSVRVSENWISADIRKANPTADELLMATTALILDWQDPDNILLPASEAKGDGPMEGMDQDINTTNTKMPDVMFVAKFNPPLVVPYSVASQIYNSTGANLDLYQPSTFDGLLFPPKVDEKHEADASHRRIERCQSVMVFGRDGEKVIKNHRNILTIQKLEYGRVMTELPFSHPRQLVDLLPILRQYACLTSILEKAFSSSQTDDARTPSTSSASPEEDSTRNQQTIRDEYEAFFLEALSASRQPLKFDILPIEVSLYTQPHPSLRLTFPFHHRTADIQFEVGANGALTITAQNVLDSDNTVVKGERESSMGMSMETVTNRRLTEVDLARALEISEHLGLFVEFVRVRLP
jgi:Mediator of RNA polymerase II transcription subunit 1